MSSSLAVLESQGEFSEIIVTRNGGSFGLRFFRNALIRETLVPALDKFPHPNGLRFTLTDERNCFWHNGSWKASGTVAPCEH